MGSGKGSGERGGGGLAVLAWSEAVITTHLSKGNCSGLIC